ncbi:MAG: PepSY domain-containing protein [Rhodospirillum sp.]|nr:PepSY domain-containing protein [Rhodospirillum sp.]MCF8488017.1 PepSY domain-containing protein [Rhodospirillum sp.]MCF8500284.1 PepSY domain-containing protein [Rhodospirillum sp.]
MKNLITSTALVAAFGATLGLTATSAMAEEQWCPTIKDGAMTEAQAAEMYGAKGYDVKNTDMEHGCIELKAIDPNGKRVEMYIDSNTGEIVKVKD